ncbi:MAG: 3-deoxy-D-manno-octulosonic acid transferase, partial [Alphaproteobacteria bacterium]
MNFLKNLFGNFLLGFYQIFSIAILPILIILILVRKSKGKEHSTRFLEKFAITKNPRNHNCKIIWIHTVSVGESNSSWSLIDEFLQFSADIQILLTSTTTSSAKLIGDKILNNPIYEKRVIHQFLPIDSYFIIRKFLQYWQPRAIILVESELWPNIITLARKKGILSFLVNARMSEKSLRRWQKLQKLGFNIFDYFSLIFVQSSKDKNIFSTLTKNNILYEGNLKIQSKKLIVNDEEIANLQQNIGLRPIFLATSTHQGEEEIIVNTAEKLLANFPDLLTIIALRHPNRVGEV